MGFLKPKVYIPPAPQAPPPPAQAGDEDTERAAALADEAMKKQRKIIVLRLGNSMIMRLNKPVKAFKLRRFSI